MSELPWYKRELSSRAMGALALVAGSVLAYMGVYQPLAAILAGEPSISMSEKAAFISPVAIGFGLIYLGFGDSAVRVLGHPQQPNKKSFVVALVLAVIGVTLVYWLHQQLKLHGYG